jgi:hypothetical protein
VNVSINIIVVIAGICLIDFCYIFVIHTQQDATHRNKMTVTFFATTNLSLIYIEENKNRGYNKIYRFVTMVY